MKKRIYLTYPKELVQESLIYQAGKLFKVETNIRQASVSSNMGLVALALEGEPKEIEKAIDFFIKKGVKVEPIELDVVE